MLFRSDLFYAKLWLARRFTAPQCRPVCCDGNAPLPFARGAFAFAMCADALMYLWQKRQFVGELFRLVDGHARATVLLNHVHSQLVWSPSHGNALPPAAYRSLCEQATPQIFGEGRLFTDLISAGTIDLTHGHSDEAVANDAALTLVASRVPQVFGCHARPAVTGRHLLELWAWSEADFLRHTEGSPIRRIGHERWLRNLAVGLGNAPASVAVVQALQRRADDPSALVREHEIGRAHV